eukprot:scaffold285741_cov29-Tisochrysis_lutea.AAC.7
MHMRVKLNGRCAASAEDCMGLSHGVPPARMHRLRRARVAARQSIDRNAHTSRHLNPLNICCFDRAHLHGHKRLGKRLVRNFGGLVDSREERPRREGEHEHGRQCRDVRR